MPGEAGEGSGHASDEALAHGPPGVMEGGLGGWHAWDHPPTLHIPRVMERVDVNRMTRQNIGIVFGPTLLRPEREPGSLAVGMAQQNKAVELLLAHFDRIFPAPP